MRTLAAVGCVGLIVAALLPTSACGSESGIVQSADAGSDVVAADAQVSAPIIFVSSGPDIAAAVRDSFVALLKQATTLEVRLVPAADAGASAGNGSLFIGLGDTAIAKELVAASELAALKSEGFILRSQQKKEGTFVAAIGKPREGHSRGKPVTVSLGSHYATYALLESLGFGFLHPLQPTIPHALGELPANLNVQEAPRWDERTMHLHTQHPLELTDLLQGWGPGGLADEAGFVKQLPEWDRYLEWCLANKQNGVEWFLLWAQSWEAFADSPIRQARLKTLVEHGQRLGLSVGIDAPISFKQQHSFRLLRVAGELPAELADIRKNLDYVLGAGFDFLGIESGTSEFTSPDPARMLAWMNETTRYADEAYKVKAHIKVHSSTNQTAVGYIDPTTGKDINFNFLPQFADKRLGVLPHTVQHYGLTDPAPTYGNSDFSDMRRFIHQEAGKRSVMFYPETAYWVSFDIDVPLFLPLYAERRVADLRMLGLDERDKRAGSNGTPMNGQLIFSSGWEWGYWLNDVVAARAAWNPHLEAASEAAGFRLVLRPTLAVFGTAAADVEQWIADTTDAEYKLLIQGEYAGKRPASVLQRNGQAYLQGWETWDDVSKVSENLPVKLPNTQPDKLGLVDVRNPLHSGPSYKNEVRPLLAEMATVFAQLAARGDALRGRVPKGAQGLMNELADASRMTALRAAQVYGLYDYANDALNPLGDVAKRRARLVEARAALDSAALIVKNRELQYRVPADRIAGWRKNPTAYGYGYLWTVRSLHYFWRDEGKAVDAPLFPCYMNLVNPVDVANGEGFGTDAVRFFGSVLSGDQQRGCLAKPSREPTYPQDGVRTRP